MQKMNPPQDKPTIDVQPNDALPPPSLLRVNQQ